MPGLVKAQLAPLGKPGGYELIVDFKPGIAVGRNYLLQEGTGEGDVGNDGSFHGFLGSAHEQVIGICGKFKASLQIFLFIHTGGVIFGNYYITFGFLAIFKAPR